jgi:hypothetical protein
MLTAVSPASAQQQAVAVQLPTFSFFTVNTSVVVPDSGAGIRAAMAREALQRSRAAAATKPDGAASLVAPRQRTATEQLADDLVAAQRSTAGRGAASLAAIRAAQLGREQSDRKRAAALQAKAAAALAAGKPEVAKVYQRMAARLHGPARQPDEHVARAASDR